MSISYTGDPTTFYPAIDYPTDGEDADEASIATLERLADNDAYLKAEVDDVQEGLPALNNRVDALAALNFPYDTIPPIINLQRDALGKVYEVYDFGFSENLQLYAAVVFDSSDGFTFIYTSPDLHEWNKDTSALTSADVCTNIVMGAASALTACMLVWNAANLKVAHWNFSGGFVATATALVGSAAFKSNSHGGGFIAGVFVWGAYDGLNNGIIITSTTGTSVSRQAFGTVGDLNHIRGPMVMAVDTAATILVAIGNTPENPIAQSQTFFLTSPDGITFTERVFPAVNPGNEIFGGIGWNADAGCFFAASTNMTSHAMRIYKSTDGITWALVNTIASPGPNAFLNFQVTGLASVNSTILVSLGTTISPTGKQWFTYSVDLGKTWISNKKNAYSNAGSDANRLHAKLRANNGQIAFGNSGHVMGSLTIGEQGTVVT